MRIIAGKYKSRCLKLPAIKHTRPTGSRIRESLFSALDSRIEFRGLSVLDGFAGSGALGLEALSRGADNVIFVEQNQAVYQVLQDNVKSIAALGSYTLIKSNLLNARLKGPFDLIFLDPPYYSGLYSQTLEHIGQNQLLSENGIITVEMAIDAVFDIPNKFQIILDRSYGKTRLVFLEKLKLDI